MKFGWLSRFKSVWGKKIIHPSRWQAGTRPTLEPPGLGIYAGGKFGGDAVQHDASLHIKGRKIWPGTKTKGPEIVLMTALCLNVMAWITVTFIYYFYPVKGIDVSGSAYQPAHMYFGEILRNRVILDTGQRGRGLIPRPHSAKELELINDMSFFGRP